MPHGSFYSRVLHLAAKPADAFRANDWMLSQIDLDGLRYLAIISVRANWFVAAIAVIELVYRPNLDFGVARYATFVLLVLVLIGFNGYIHYRLLSHRPITWRWLFALYALDVFLVSAMLALSYGFNHDFVHLFYYPALALMAVLFASFRLNMAWVTITSLVYVAISLTVGDGIDTEAGDEKALLARIAVMLWSLLRSTWQPGSSVSGGGRRWSGSGHWSVSGSSCPGPFTIPLPSPHT